MRSSAKARGFVWILATLMPAACSQDLGIDRRIWTCDPARACASGWSCVAGICVREGSDSGGIADLPDHATFPDPTPFDPASAPDLPDPVVGDPAHPDAGELSPDALGDSFQPDPADLPGDQEGPEVPDPSVCVTHEDCPPGKLCGLAILDGKLHCGAACDGIARCGPGETCTHAPGTANLGYCQASPYPAGGVAGAGCTQDSDCSSGSCVEGRCRNACSGQAGCPAGAGTCQAVGSLADGVWGACLPDASDAGIPLGQECTLGGGTYDGALCRSGHCDLLAFPPLCVPLCGTDAQCGADQECNIVQRTTGSLANSVRLAAAFPLQTYDTILACFLRQFPGSLAVGAACKQASDCRTNKCFAMAPGDPTKRCTTFCFTDADCPQDMACRLEAVAMVSYWLSLGFGPGNLPYEYTLARVCKPK